jgi:hypothetical protein
MRCALIVTARMFSSGMLVMAQQKERLSGLGYTEQQIWKMKPEDAHAILKEGIKV